MTGTWRAIARSTIEAAIASAPPGIDRRRTIELIDEAYPFGPREHYPYRVWLEERKTAIARLDGWQPEAGRIRFEGSLVPLLPVPELEEWLRRHTGRAS